MIERTYSFTANGENIEVYTITNALGMKMEVMTGGARILSLTAPDREGNMGDIIMGYARPEDYYEREKAYYGAFIGRYGNRIGGGSFSIDGVEYRLSVNDHGNTLHGGEIGFDLRNATATVKGENTLSLFYLSPDGEMGFPGTLKCTVDYTLSNEGELIIDYYAVSDRDTVCNLTNHAYFNIGNDDDILEQILDINSSYITPTDDNLIPSGELLAIDGTPFSFKGGVALGKNMNSDEHLIALCGGFDFNYCLDRKTENELEFCASVYDQKSGRMMECYTTLPGVQLYTQNVPSGFTGKKSYPNHASLCLETQCYPNSPNCPSYPTTLLKKGQEYKTKTVYKLSLK